MTKELFLKCIAQLEHGFELENAFCSVLESMSPNTYIDAFIYSSYENLIFDIIEESFNKDCRNIVEYYTCDLNFGKDYNDGDCIIGTKEFKLRNADELYTLVEYLKNKEQNKEAVTNEDK